MHNEIKKAIEEAVLADIDYILNYDPIAKKAMNAEFFAKMPIIKPIAANVYPQIYVDLVNRFDRDEATRRLKRLGLRVTKFFYSTFPNVLKKNQKFSEIFIKTAKANMNEKLKIVDEIKEDKTLKSCKFIVEHCFFCSDITPFENIEIPYCCAKSGLYENLYNIKSLYNEITNNVVSEPRLVKIDTIKSLEYEGDVCEYQLVVLE